MTAWSNSSKNALCFIHLSLKLLSLEPVTMARGILCLCRCRTSLSAPETRSKYIDKQNTLRRDSNGIDLPRPLSNDPRFIQFIYNYSQASKRFVYLYMN